MKVLKLVMVALIICALALTVACSNKNKNNNTTMIPNTTGGTSNTILNAQNGNITDSSKKGDNGIVGDVVTDISTMLSTAK